MSVRVLDEETNTFSIKHYRIKKLPDGQVGVSSKKPFNSVVELVAYYRGQDPRTAEASEKYSLAR